MHQRIKKAIDSYKQAHSIPKVQYSDMQCYIITILRFWDWGDKHILSKDKYMLIQPYLKEENNES